MKKVVQEVLSMVVSMGDLGVGRWASLLVEKKVG